MVRELDYRGVMNVLGSREKFAQGDVACAYGAILGGCDFFAGYPITPATEVAEAMARIACDLEFDRIAAIPYAGLPIGVALALETEQPLIYPRREVKAHGTHRAIEGAFEPRETALVVDDLITRGDSKLEAIAPLEAAGLTVRDVLVLIDREQGGVEDLAQRGYRLHAIFRLTEILDILKESGCITPTQHAEVLAYLGAQ